MLDAEDAHGCHPAQRPDPWSAGSRGRPAARASRERREVSCRLGRDVADRRQAPAPLQPDDRNRLCRGGRTSKLDGALSENRRDPDAGAGKRRDRASRTGARIDGASGARRRGGSNRRPGRRPLAAGRRSHGRRREPVAARRPGGARRAARARRDRPAGRLCQPPRRGPSSLAPRVGRARDLPRRPDQDLLSPAVRRRARQRRRCRPVASRRRSGTRQDGRGLSYPESSGPLRPGRQNTGGGSVHAHGPVAWGAVPEVPSSLRAARREADARCRARFWRRLQSVRRARARHHRARAARGRALALRPRGGRGVRPSHPRRGSPPRARSGGVSEPRRRRGRLPGRRASRGGCTECSPVDGDPPRDRRPTVLSPAGSAAAG